MGRLRLVNGVGGPKVHRSNAALLEGHARAELSAGGAVVFEAVRSVVAELTRQAEQRAPIPEGVSLAGNRLGLAFAVFAARPADRGAAVELAKRAVEYVAVARELEAEQPAELRCRLARESMRLGYALEHMVPDLSEVEG